MNKKAEINRVVRESICEALICLMKKKPFVAISITELIEKAGVARATYYRNFESKEDVAREYIFNVTSEIADESFDVSNLATRERVHLYWQYIDRYKDTLVLYYRAGLGDLLVNWLSDLAFYKFDMSKISADEELYFTAFIGALYNVSRRWIMDGAHVPYERMAENFEKVIPKRI